MDSDVLSGSFGDWTHTFSLWCLNPAVVFQDIANLSLSVILTSGYCSHFGHCLYIYYYIVQLLSLCTCPFILMTDTVPCTIALIVCHACT